MYRNALLAAIAVVLVAAAVPATAAVEAPDRHDATGAIAASDADATLSGTVTTDDGAFTDGYVLAVAEANASLATEATPGELLAAAEDGQDGVYATQVDDGEYSLTVPETGTYYVVATDGVNASGAAEVAVEGDTTQNLSVGLVTGAEAVTSAGSAGTTTAGDRIPALIRVPNPTDHVTGPYTATVGDLPDGWTIDGNESEDGTWSAESSTWEWDRIPAGTRGAGTLYLQIPDDAEPGEYEIPVTVTVGDGVVVDEFVWTVTVEEETTTATTVAPDPNGTTTTTGTNGTTVAPTDTTTAGDDGGGSPGFGPVAVLLALGLLAVGARRR